uniref:Uncharacterized protein n=1 Tax=Salix viminalis TaxID=40686 RepID=A0A6N2L4L6_SALVM
MIVMYAYVVFVVMFYKDDDFKPAGLGFTALYAYVISAAVNITARITVFPCDYIVDDNMGVELGLGELSNY